MARRAKRKDGALMFEFEVFPKQMYCIEESACDIVGTFLSPLAPHSDSGPGEFTTFLASLVTPLVLMR